MSAAKKAPKINRRVTAKLWAEEIAVIMQLQHDGYSLAVIAEALDCSTCYMSYALQRAKIHGFDAYPRRP